jgi:deoxyribonuclease IV
MSTAGGVWRALERGAGIGCDVVQIFVKNNMQWAGPRHSEEACGRFAQLRQSTGLRLVFGHTGYLLNLASPPSTNRDRSIASLILEIELAASLGLPFLVLHPGAHLGAGESTGLRRVVEALDQVFRATKRFPVRIALENTAGQGTCLGHRLEQLAAIYDRVGDPARLAVCLDTAHLFAAGYDFRRPAGWDAVVRDLEMGVGVEQVVAFHLNDSKTELGSRVDRHEAIGKGKIGLGGFRNLLADRRFQTLPGCLETPKSEDLHEDVQNLRVLRRMGGARMRTREVGTGKAGGR